MPDLTGKSLGKYQLLERLGRGGMAEVYRAYHPALDREAALKIMHGFLAEDESFVGRFQREAKAVAALHHPNIVQVYDFDIQDDVYYMVMEYIKGETLKARIERTKAEGKRVPLDEVIKIFRPLCDALDYAHEQGRVHRDIKPANIMIDGDRLVLTDFGIAAIVGGTRYTASGAVVGTPAYMAPELGLGQVSDLRADIYSLGVVLYELVTGQVPYDADTPFAVVLKHIHEPLPAPSLVSKEVPPPVERVILKAMAKEAGDRYASCGELAAALEAALNPALLRATESIPTTPTLSAAAPVKKATFVPVAPVAHAARRPSPILMFSVLGLAVIILLSVAGVFVSQLAKGNQAESPPPTALLRDDEPALPPANLPEQIPYAAVEHFEAGTTALWSEYDMETALRELSRAIEIHPAYADAYLERSQVYIHEEQWELALQDLNQVITLQPDRGEAYLERARLYLNILNQRQAAMADLSAAIEMNPEFIEAYLERAMLNVWYLDNFPQGMADLERVLEIDPNNVQALTDRAEIYFYEEKFELAIADLQQALEIDPENIYLWDNLGEVYYWAGDFGLAVDSYTHAIAVDPSLEHYYNRAFAYLAVGNDEAALEDFNRVILLQSDRYGGYYGRGRIMVDYGRYEEALSDFDVVIASEDQDWMWPYFNDADPRIDKALVLQALERYEEAIALLDEVLREDEYWYLPYYHRGQVYQALGNREAAAADFRLLWEYAPDDEWRASAEEALRDLEEQ